MVPIIILYDGQAAFDQVLRELDQEKSLRESEHYIVQWEKCFAQEVIIPGQKQLLVVGIMKEDREFAVKMKMVNGGLQVMRFGSFIMKGPPKDPFDYFCTWADPVHTYKNSFIMALNEFLTKPIKRR